MRPWRRRQTGAVYTGAVEGIAYLIVGGGALLLLVFIAASIYGLVKTRGRARWLVVVAVCAWVIPLWQCTSRTAAEKEADDAQRARWRAAWGVCDSELPGLPASIQGRSLLDEGPGMMIDVWRAMLGERQLEFIEMRLPHGTGRPGIRVYADGSGAGVFWPVDDHPAGSLVRIDLSNDGNRDCETGRRWLWPKTDDSNEFRLPPFLPDTCLKLSYPPLPSADLALSLTGPDPGSGPLNQWRLVERSSGRVAAALTTSALGDDRTVSSFGGEFPDHDESRRNDCRDPRSILVSRVFGVRGEMPPRQLVSMQTVPVKTQPDALQPERRVPARLTSEAAAEQQFLSLTSGGEPLAEWKLAVESAKAEGHAGYGAWWLDWPKRRMERLSFDADAKTHGIWIFQADASGYYMWSFWDSDRREPVLAHYGRDGGLDWSVRVAPNPGPEAATCSWQNPKELKISPEQLTLIGRGWCKAGPERTRLTWTIARRDLPL